MTTRTLGQWREQKKSTDEVDRRLAARRPKGRAKASPTNVRAALETIERIAAEEGVTLATEVRSHDYSGAPGTSPREIAMRAAGR